MTIKDLISCFYMPRLYSLLPDSFFDFRIDRETGIQTDWEADFLRINNLKKIGDRFYVESSATLDPIPPHYGLLEFCSEVISVCEAEFLHPIDGWKYLITQCDIDITRDLILEDQKL